MFTFIKEAIDSVNWGTFVVSSEQKKVVRVFNFIGQQKTNSLKIVLSPINIISQEQIITLRRESAIIKEPNQVFVLPMDIT